MKFSTVIGETVEEETIDCVVVDLENPTSTDLVTIAIGTNPGPGTLGGTLTVAAVNGVAVFDDLDIYPSGDGYTLVATAVIQRNGCANFSPFGAFQSGYFYNPPVSGDVFPKSLLNPDAIHGNVVVPPETMSVTSNPFNIIT
jgi:hypothetical protein